ncbi:MAG: type II toxin-antitoxin system RelE/ParE family toxin [Planctomycetes bacterium]|nr:type II toxin-antitoxin system RelE/ParE family toxin [Planctomycetota bacterium]
MKPVIFYSEAEAELEEASDYYDMRRLGLGAEFETAVEEAVSRVSQTPRAFAAHGDQGLRECLVRRFPYTVYFFERDADIWIAAVAHQSRKPDYWSSREPE